MHFPLSGGRKSNIYLLTFISAYIKQKKSKKQSNPDKLSRFTQAWTLQWWFITSAVLITQPSALTEWTWVILPILFSRFMTASQGWSSPLLHSPGLHRELLCGNLLLNSSESDGWKGLKLTTQSIHISLVPIIYDTFNRQGGGLRGGIESSAATEGACEMGERLSGWAVDLYRRSRNGFRTVRGENQGWCRRQRHNKKI